MTEEVDNIISPFCTIPNEILLNIFTFLPATELMKCRLVCIRWKLISDRLAHKESFWVDLCKKDFKENYLIARQKAGRNRNITAYYLYRSLYLWSKLAYAEEERHDFALASNIESEVCDIKVLNDGVLGVRRKDKIEFYNADTLKMASREYISGNYAGYSENENVVVILSCRQPCFYLLVVRKVLYSPDDEIKTMFENVKMYHLSDTKLCYVTFNNEIYVCNILQGQKIIPEFIKCAEDEDGVMSLAFSDGCLNVLTFQRNIWSITANNDIYLKLSINSGTNMLNVLYKYNFLNEFDWLLHFYWMYVLHLNVENDGPLRNIGIIRSYGDLFFVGTKSGILSIYYNPFNNGELDFFNSEPIRQINFTDALGMSDTPCCIVQIDFLETINGHMVFVALPEKIAVLKYTYKFLHPISWSVSSYGDTEQAMCLSETSN